MMKGCIMNNYIIIIWMCGCLGFLIGTSLSIMDISLKNNQSLVQIDKNIETICKK